MKRLLLLAVLLAMLNGCAWNDRLRAASDLKAMNSGDYFENPVQSSFVAFIGKGDVRRADELLKQGAGVNAVGKDGMTPLFWALSKQNLEGFRYLLAHGANPNLIADWHDANGRAQSETALRLAAMLEDKRYLEDLLAAGGNPNLMDEVGQTPIYVAILHQRRDTLELLLDKGADIDHVNRSLTTPINYAVSMNHYSLALLLLSRGADPKIEDRWGYSAIDTTKKFGKGGVVRGSDDEAAYTEFVSELKARGVW